LGAGANVNDTAPDGTSALVIAAHSGHGAFGRFLLERGADPDSAGAGYTALHAAVLRGELALVTALLTRGANPNSRLERGTPVTRNGKDWVLLDTWAGATPIWLAAKFLEFEIIRALAAGGADVRLPSADGTTPLMVAAGVGWGREAVDRRERTSFVDPTKAPDDGPALGVVKLLMELGADSRAANKAGDTALHGAAAKGLNALVQFLVTSGASLDVKNKRAQTPLAATMGGSMDGKAQFEFEYLRSTAALLRRLGAKQ
jgi:ankyrin repeat protein